MDENTREIKQEELERKEQIKHTSDEVYKLVSEFLKKYPWTLTWRIRQHSNVIAKHLNGDEEVYYIFAAQKNSSAFNIFSTCLIAFTSKRILIGQKRVLWGYNLTSITPDMFNDFEVYKGLIFGRLDIDTVKEVIRLSDIDPKALVDIETNLSEYILKVKPRNEGANKN